MPRKLPKPEYAHIASLIRSKLEEYNWRVADLNSAMGLERNSTTAYTWLNAHGAPLADSRVRLAKALSVDETELLAKTNVQLPVKQEKRIVTYKNKPKVIYEPPRVFAPKVEPLNFTVLADGSARIQLDITMPLDNAKALLRMILDADVIFKK